MTVDLAGTGSYRPPAKPRYTPLNPMRAEAARSIGKLAERVQQDHPDLTIHQHIRDAARTLRAGNEEASQRHLRAAMFALSPQSLMRNGQHTDDAHMAARATMHGVHRHLLLVKDIEDVKGRNQEAIQRDSYGDDRTAPDHPDPNAGYGPGALAQKPTARQPGGGKAMNAPDRTNSGGSDPAVADPGGKQPKTVKVIAASSWDELSAVIDMAGPGGWEHGWHYVGGPGLPPPKTKGLRAPGKMDPRSVIAVGGGRKNWENEASQMPGRQVSHDFPAIAGRMRQITPERVQQARDDDDRISDGLAPLHPELAQVWPGIYGKAQGVTAPLGTPKAPRIKHDPRSVTGLSGPRVDYIKAALRQASPSSYTFSADTGRLAVTPAPRGKPGGPGLYGVKGNQHSPYMQQIVKALIEKRGMDPGKAYAIAWGAMRKWAKGGGKAHPEVRAAAAGGLGQEKAAEARAHAHSASWDDVAGVIALTGTAAGAALDPRLAAGVAGGGQFGSGGSAAGAAAGGKNAKGSQKAALLKQAAALRARAYAMIRQLAVLRKAHASASGKVAKGQAGAKTAAKAVKTASTAPGASKTAKAASPVAAQISQMSSAASKAVTPAQVAAVRKRMNSKQMATAISALGKQVTTLMTQAAQLTAQAAKL
jgi:hypothetical protein